MSDLTKRLRAVEGTSEGTHWYRNPDGPEAAAEIGRLRARVEELTKLVETAYREGWSDGFDAGRRAARNSREWRQSPPAADWWASDARAALSEPPTGETAE